MLWFKRFLARFFWMDISSAKKDRSAMLLWDEYYYMRLGCYIERSELEIYQTKMPDTTSPGFWCLYAPYSDFDIRAFKGNPPGDFFLDPIKYKRIKEPRGA